MLVDELLKSFKIRPSRVFVHNRMTSHGHRKTVSGCFDSRVYFSQGLRRPVGLCRTAIQAVGERKEGLADRIRE